MEFPAISRVVAIGTHITLPQTPCIISVQHRHSARPKSLVNHIRKPLELADGGAEHTTPGLSQNNTPLNPLGTAQLEVPLKDFSPVLIQPRPCSVLDQV